MTLGDICECLGTESGELRNRNIHLRDKALWDVKTDGPHKNPEEVECNKVSTKYL